MKKIIFVALVLMCTYATNFAQNMAPLATVKAFKQKFPNATNVKWGKENPNNYEASFELKSTKYSANFSDIGEWLETESPYSFGQLPEKVQAGFKKIHNDVIPKAVSKIETSKKGTIYEIEVAEGVKTVELFYKPDGTETKE